MNNSSKSEICLVIAVLFFATIFMGCTDSPGGDFDLSLDLHEFQYDTESINLAVYQEGNLHANGKRSKMRRSSYST